MTWTTPKTWNTGDVLTAPDLNTFVGGDFAWAYGDTTFVLPTLNANWVQWGFGLPTLYLVRRGNVVTITGVLKNNSGATQGVNSIVATLPSGYIPVATQAVMADGNAAYARVNVNNPANGSNIIIGVGSIVAAGFLDIGGSYLLV